MLLLLLCQEVQRDKAEQVEKARLRHKHALAQLQLEEVKWCLVMNIKVLEYNPCISLQYIIYYTERAIQWGRPLYSLGN